MNQEKQNVYEDFNRLGSFGGVVNYVVYNCIFFNKVKKELEKNFVYMLYKLVCGCGVFCLVLVFDKDEQWVVDLVEV